MIQGMSTDMDRSATPLAPPTAVRHSIVVVAPDQSGHVSLQRLLIPPHLEDLSTFNRDTTTTIMMILAKDNATHELTSRNNKKEANEVTGPAV